MYSLSRKPAGTLTMFALSVREGWTKDLVDPEAIALTALRRTVILDILDNMVAVFVDVERDVLLQSDLGPLELAACLRQSP